VTIEEIRELYSFNAWANQRVFDTCAALSQEQFTQHVLSSYPSVRETLVHIIAGEWIWLELWLGRSHAAAERQSYAGKLTDMARVHAGWAEVEKERQQFLSTLTPANLEHVVEYRNLQGNRFAYSLRRMLQHVVNHSTYHRGQVTTLLRQLGAATCATDYLRYFDWLAGDREE